MQHTPWIILLVSSTLLECSTLYAHDFGTHGHTFEIIEPDLLQQIQGKLKILEETGELSKHNDRLIARAKKSLYSPEPVKGITHATEDRTFFYDPSITVPYDLKDHEGKVFHKAGTKINPLKFKSLSASLIFIDGNAEDQVAWLKSNWIKEVISQEIKASKSFKIILVAGSPFQLMELWNQQVYFDQGGRLTKKLCIKHVPAVVSQENLKLKIREIALKETRLMETGLTETRLKEDSLKEHYLKESSLKEHSFKEHAK